MIKKVGWYQFYRAIFLLISFMGREKINQKKKRRKKNFNMGEMMRERVGFLEFYWFVKGVED